MGDATNLVIVLAGEMLRMAEGLIRIGLHPSEIANGYEKACEFALKTLEGLFVVCPRIVHYLYYPRHLVLTCYLARAHRRQNPGYPLHR